MVEAAHQALEKFVKTNEAAAVLIDSSGDKAFCAGQTCCSGVPRMFLTAAYAAHSWPIDQPASWSTYNPYLSEKAVTYGTSGKLSWTSHTARTLPQAIV